MENLPVIIADVSVAPSGESFRNPFFFCACFRRFTVGSIKTRQITLWAVGLITTNHDTRPIRLTISVRQAVIAARRSVMLVSRQACLPAIATSSFKIFLTQSFPRRGATCYILPWREMSQLFNGVNFGYRSADVYRSFQTYLGVLVRIRYFHNGAIWRVMF